MVDGGQDPRGDNPPARVRLSEADQLIPNFPVQRIRLERMSCGKKLEFLHLLLYL